MRFIKFIRIFLLVLIIIGIGLILTQKMWVPKVVDMIMKGENKEQGTLIDANIQNKITLTSKVDLSSAEKDQISKSVDGYMNEYKLPKGIQNSYIISIEKRLNESIRIVVNPGDEGDFGNIIIYARKIGGTWQVNPSGGPWCTLEEFDSGECL